MSYTCLTSFNMRQALRNMKDTDLEFWNELTMKMPEDLSLPDETKIMPKDENLLTAELDDEDFDDSEVPIKVVIALLDTIELPRGIAPHEGGSLISVRAAESLEETSPVPEKLGPGRKPNTRYRVADFWRHNDSDGSDVEAEEWDATCKWRLFWHHFPRQLKTDFFTLQNLILVIIFKILFPMSPKDLLESENSVLFECDISPGEFVSLPM